MLPWVLWAVLAGLIEPKEDIMGTPVSSWSQPEAWCYRVKWGSLLGANTQSTRPDASSRWPAQSEAWSMASGKAGVADYMSCVETVPHTWGGVPRIVLSLVCEGVRVVICLAHTWREELHRESEFQAVETHRGISVHLFHMVFILQGRRSGNDTWATLGSYKPTISQALLAAHVNHLHPLYLWVQVSWDFQQGPGNIRTDYFSNLRLLHMRCQCGYCGSLCLCFRVPRNSHHSSG